MGHVWECSLVLITTTDNPEASLNDWLDDSVSGERVLIVEYDYSQYYLPGEPLIRLLVVYCQSGSQVFFTVMAADESMKRAVISMGEQLENLRAFTREMHLPLYELGRPLVLEAVSIAKPWGREIWYTGIEERGVSKVTDGFASAPLPWVLSAAPERLSANRARHINLLKILDPLSEEIFGDLYFELHEQKREVYVVTHVDEGAWPDVVGAIRYGLCEEVRRTYPSDDDFKAAYLDAVKCYEVLRREIDKELDGFRKLEGLAPSEPVTADVMKRWISMLPSVVVEQERVLRENMNRFTSLRPLKKGDVIKVPLLVPHSLQHGVRTVEFQTPVYERKILSFAQKVLTQNHWDTEQAVNLMSVDSPPIDDLVVLEQTEAYRLEEVVKFDDFQVRRLIIESGAEYELMPSQQYALLMVVSGQIACQGELLSSEMAVLMPADRPLSLLTNSHDDGAILLLALPI
jgi:hypothetical protein